MQDFSGRIVAVTDQRLFFRCRTGVPIRGTLFRRQRPRHFASGPAELADGEILMARGMLGFGGMSHHHKNHHKGDTNEGEGNRTADQAYRAGVQAFITTANAVTMRKNMPIANLEQNSGKNRTLHFSTRGAETSFSWLKSV